MQVGDQRVAAAGLSLGQDLAGNSCVTFSMIAISIVLLLAMATVVYRYVHFEAGAIGHRLYLAAEALGLGATASAPSTMMRCTVILTSNSAEDRSYIILRSVIRFPIRASSAFNEPTGNHMVRPYSCTATIISSCAADCRIETLREH